jgi:hypothetical protein
VTGLWVLWFPSPLQLSAIVESDIQHHKPTNQTIELDFESKVKDYFFQIWMTTGTFPV